MFSVIPINDGFKLNHLDFNSVNKVTYKNMEVTGSIGMHDSIYLEVEGVYVPVFYHCGGQDKIELGNDVVSTGIEAEEIIVFRGITDGPSAFYEFKDDKPLDAIVLCVENVPYAVVGFADYKARFCCPLPIFREEARGKAGYLAQSNQHARADGFHETKEIDGFIRWHSKLSVSVSTCNDALTNGSFAMTHDIIVIDVKEFGEKHGIPYRCDCDLLLSYNSDIDPRKYQRRNGNNYDIAEVEINYYSAKSKYTTEDFLLGIDDGMQRTDGFPYTERNRIPDCEIDDGVLKIEQYPQNQQIRIALDGSSDEMLEKIAIRVSSFVGIDSDIYWGMIHFGPAVPFSGTRYFNLNYLQVDPSSSSATLQAMDELRNPE